MRLDTSEETGRTGPLSWRVRAALIVLFVAAVATVYVTNQLLTAGSPKRRATGPSCASRSIRATCCPRSAAAAIVPQLLARDRR